MKFPQVSSIRPWLCAPTCPSASLSAALAILGSFTRLVASGLQSGALRLQLNTLVQSPSCHRRTGHHVDAKHTETIYAIRALRDIANEQIHPLVLWIGA